MFNFPLAPHQASSFAREYDLIFGTLVALTVIFTLLVGAGVVFFAVRYRAGSKASRKNPVYESPKLEVVLAVVPTILGLIMFFFGARLYIKMRTPPPNAEEIFVIGKQWMWHVQHPNGVREQNTLHVPVGRPVKLTMISQDVIHAFYIPAFRTDMYVLPGRYTQEWFTATKPGQYHLFCNLYCGTQHSEMGGTVIAMEPKEYAEWLANGGETTPTLTMAQQGAKLFSKLGCNNCHTGSDTPRGPSLNGIFGKKRTFSNAEPATADEPYLREAILRPYNKLTSGYGQSMPAYEGQITEEQVLALIAFMKTWSGGTMPPTAALNGDTKTLNVGAEQANAHSNDSTPTVRTGDLAVGAVAAEGETKK